MYSLDVRPIKAMVLAGLITKYVEWVQHLQTVISMTASAKARATLEGKYAKLVDV